MSSSTLLASVGVEWIGEVGFTLLQSPVIPYPSVDYQRNLEKETPAYDNVYTLITKL